MTRWPLLLVLLTFPAFAQSQELHSFVEPQVQVVEPGETLFVIPRVANVASVAAPDVHYHVQLEGNATIVDVLSRDMLPCTFDEKTVDCTRTLGSHTTFETEITIRAGEQDGGTATVVVSATSGPV